MSADFTYTDDNLRICDDNYNKLSRMYSGIRAEISTTSKSILCLK